MTPTLTGYAEFMPMVGIAIALHKKKGDENDISFNRGCPKCHAAAKQKIVCEACKLTDIKTTECVKLYQEKGQEPIWFTEDEIKAVKGTKDKKMSFKAEAYIPAEEFDPLWIRETYEMSPDENGGETFAYIREGMAAKKVVAIGTMVLYGKKRTCAVVPKGNWMMFYSLEYADTVRKSEELCKEAEAWTPTRAELDADAIEGAVAKIEEMPTTVDYKATRNEREANVLAAIEARRKNPQSAVIPLTVEVVKPQSGIKNLFLAASAKKRAA